MLVHAVAVEASSSAWSASETGDVELYCGATDDLKFAAGEVRQVLRLLDAPVKRLVIYDAKESDIEALRSPVANVARAGNVSVVFRRGDLVGNSVDLFRGLKVAFEDSAGSKGAIYTGHCVKELPWRQASMPATSWTTVRILRLVNMELSSLPNGCFDACPLMEELDLRDNHLDVTGAPWWRDAPALRDAEISDSARCEGVDPEVAAFMDIMSKANVERRPVLERILLAGNQLRWLYASATPHERMDKSEIHDPLPCIPASHAGGLRVLDLSRNRLTGEVSLLSKGLAKTNKFIELERLNFSQNSFVDVSSEWLRRAKRLAELDLSWNLISDESKVLNRQTRVNLSWNLHALPHPRLVALRLRRAFAPKRVVEVDLIQEAANRFSSVKQQIVNKVLLGSNVADHENAVRGALIRFGRESEEFRTLLAEFTIRHSQALSEISRLRHSLVGQDNVWDTIQRVLRAHQGALVSGRQLPLPHFTFTGDPGVGKSHVAKAMAAIFRSANLIKTGKCIEGSRANMVSAEVGGKTHLLTMELCDKAEEGVLFIDEAYSLQQAGSKQDHGKQAIEALLEALTDSRRRFVLILAGYKSEMRQMLRSNLGLESRIRYQVVFTNFTASNMEAMLEKKLLALGVETNVVDGAVAECSTFLQSVVGDPIFANARGVNNLAFEIADSIFQKRFLVSKMGRDHHLALSPAHGRSIAKEATLRVRRTSHTSDGQDESGNTRREIDMFLRTCSLEEHAARMVAQGITLQALIRPETSAEDVGLASLGDRAAFAGRVASVMFEVEPSRQCRIPLMDKRPDTLQALAERVKECLKKSGLQIDADFSNVGSVRAVKSGACLSRADGSMDWTGVKTDTVIAFDGFITWLLFSTGADQEKPVFEPIYVNAVPTMDTLRTILKVAKDKEMLWTAPSSAHHGVMVRLTRDIMRARLATGDMLCYD
jgi:hypothetical protein